MEVPAYVRGIIDVEKAEDDVVHRERHKPAALRESVRKLEGYIHDLPR